MTFIYFIEIQTLEGMQFLFITEIQTLTECQARHAVAVNQCLVRIGRGLSADSLCEHRAFVGENIQCPLVMSVKQVVDRMLYLLSHCIKFQ